MKTDLEWFRTFRTVYEMGTMSEAARHLGLSQPGVSLHLTALEGLVGFTLFERTPGRRLQPTERSRMLYQRLNPLLTQIEAVEKSFGTKEEGHRVTLSVGIGQEMLDRGSAVALSELSFDLHLLVGTSDELATMLRDGTCDLIVGSFGRPAPGWEFEPLGPARFMLVAGPKTAVRTFERIDVSDRHALQQWLRAQLWYGTADLSYLELFWQQNFGCASHIRPGHVLPDYRTIARSLSLGQGLSFLPALLCTPYLQSGLLRSLWDGYSPFHPTLYFGHRSNSLKQKEIAQMKQIIRAEFEKMR